MGLVEWVVDREVPGGRLRAGFTARAGGVSTGSYAGLNLGFHVGDDPGAVAENRRLLELEAPGLAWMDQVHGDALAPGAAATTSWGTPSVDIPRALVRQLASRGVEEVRLLGVCTFEDPAYFSHRRACAAGGKAGRFAGIAEATRDTPA